MTTENEWVKLPNPAPKMLPKGTRARSIGCTSEYVALEDAPRGAFDQFVGPWKGRHWTHKGIGFLIEVWLPPGYRFEGSEVVKDEAKRSYCHKRHGGYTQLCDENCLDDDLGDTPEHLKPLLRAAREKVLGTVVTESERRYLGCTIQLWGPGRSGFVYDGQNNYANVESYGTDEFPGSLGRLTLRELIEQGRCYPTADARRIGREEFGVSSSAGGCGGAGAGGGYYSEFGRGYVVHKGTSVGMSSTIPSCACGATTNLRAVAVKREGVAPLRVTRCGACHRSVRQREVRAELQARKLEQVKRDLDRTSKAPPSWPEGAGDDYEL